MIQMAKVSIPDLVIYDLNFFSFLDHVSMEPYFYVCKDQWWPSWGFLEGLSRLGLFFCKMDDPFKVYVQRLKTHQFWGPYPIFFDGWLWGLGVNGSKLYIIH